MERGGEWLERGGERLICFVGIVMCVYSLYIYIYIYRTLFDYGKCQQQLAANFSLKGLQKGSISLDSTDIGAMVNLLRFLWAIKVSMIRQRGPLSI